MDGLFPWRAIGHLKRATSRKRYLPSSVGAFWEDVGAIGRRPLANFLIGHVYAGGTSGATLCAAACSADGPTLRRRTVLPETTCLFNYRAPKHDRDDMRNVIDSEKFLIVV